MKIQMKRERLLASTMIAGAALIGFAAPAAAQNTSSEEQASQVSDVVVTGSRIRVRDTTGSSPIVTVGAEQLEEIGTATIETYLNALPQLSPSLTKTNNNPSSGGAAFLDLRQLGTSRGLTLVNGRRLVPGSASGAVDISILPSGLMDRVEIITGGASAVYGADAVSGVVNFLLKDDFEGAQVSAQYGISQENDGKEVQYNLVLGGPFADGRGHLTFAASHNTRDGIPQTAREISRTAQYCYNDGSCVPDGSGTTGDGTFSISPSATAAQLATYQSYFAARGLTDPDLIYAGQRLGFNPDGSLFIAGTGDGTFGYTGPNTGGWNPDEMFLYDFNPVNLLQSPYERTNFYTQMKYDLTDRIQFYGDALFSTYNSSNQLAESPAGFSIPVATTTTLSPEVRALLTSAGVTTFALARRTNELGPRTYNYDTTAYQATGGFRGNLPPIYGKEWAYDVYASYGKYRNTQEYVGFPEANRIRAALAGCPTGSPTGPVGRLGTPTTCVPLNPFGANNITPDQADYIAAKGQVGVTEIEQKNVVASITGDLFTLPAGPVSFAFGGEYRDIAYDDLPPEGVQTGTLLGGNSAGPVQGGYDVWEVFGELRVPILAEQPFAHYLGLEGGYRWSDYSIGQATETWKYGGEWAPVDWMRFRALQQRAVRAPSVGELFSTRAEGYPGVTTGNLDPCDKDSAARTGANASQVLALCQTQSSQITATWDSVGTQYRTFSGGNQNLNPETADSTTIGVVFRAPSSVPSWASSLTATIDYFDIQIDDVISSIGFSTSLSRCFNADFNPTFSNSNVYCQNLNRDADTGYLTNTGLNGFITATNANLATFKASGVDMALNYSITPADYGAPSWLGRLGFSTQGTWYENQQFQSDAASPMSDSFVGGIGDGTPGETTLPEWKFNTRFSWAYEDFSASLRWTYISSVVDDAADVAAGDIGKIDAYSYFYLNASWAVNDTLELFGGVDNLFDKDPPRYASGFQYQTDPSTYDVIGRYFYVGARARF
ncbi:Outer membrane cobalamin translocator [Brevundimonas diminuta]|uniref:TonB-dependent receptor plug domain-containing protein n=1 Tax=Brevundimonas TaxID=41275 RepID=UPI00096F6E35|nr:MULTISPECIES: TonB-dependent receptor [Brevundimonas]MBD3818785.1 TonB-dependent receptor [Brevundimonas diminuta]OMG55473.1 TonB-dependent receptor [Brevundimonas sp. ZS04]SPU47677.1 Outer membrane cobalamin translocator [Brevundimonas diminuta]